VLHVVPTFDPISVPSDRFGAATTLVHPPTREAVEAEVRGTLLSDEVDGLEVAVVAAAGDPVRVIVEHAAAADLVVMGAHGRSGFDRLLSGSVTERVFQLAPCPVLAVPPQAASAGGPEAVFRRILCPVDFSPSSERALDVALDLARQANGVLTAATVIEWLAEEVPPASDRGHAHAPEGPSLRPVAHVVRHRRGGQARAGAPRGAAARGREAERPDCDGRAGPGWGQSRVLRIHDAARRPGRDLPRAGRAQSDRDMMVPRRVTCERARNQPAGSEQRGTGAVFASQR